MERSFVEYRNNSGKSDDSNEEVIDNSFTGDQSFTLMPKTPFKNKTVFVAESDDSDYKDDTESNDEDVNTKAQITNKLVSRRSTIDNHIVLSSDEATDGSRGSIRRDRKNSTKVVVSCSSEEEDEASPELIPKRRPLRLDNSKLSNRKTSDSPLIRRVKKRMILSDSDTSLVENDKKLICTKPTPLKTDSGVKRTADQSMDYSNVDPEMTDDESESADDDEESDNNTGDDSNDENDDKSHHDTSKQSDNADGVTSDQNNDDGAHADNASDDDDDEAGDYEERLVMTRATRMSIMGVMAGDLASDESDFIQSDESNRKSRISEEPSHSEEPHHTEDELPDPGMTGGTRAPDPAPEAAEEDLDDSKISCSTFGSPAHDRSHLSDKSPKDDGNRVYSPLKTSFDRSSEKVRVYKGRSPAVAATVDLTHVELVPKREVEDDDVTIIDTKPEVIDLSSDNDDDPASPRIETSTSPMKASPMKASPVDAKPSKQESQRSLRQYLVPASCPNQVVYVKKSVRENELAKLRELKADLHNVRNLLDNMELEQLPDGGARLVERLAALERQAKAQGDKVANMVVEPEAPTAADVARDGLGAATALSWDDIQKASHQVQPKFFGKQGMFSHMAERNLILSRLGALHASLASRPPADERAPAPRGLRATLLPHQQHALAWLAWRERQRPRGGILADDMGLGKTITILALILKDKEDGDDRDEEDGDEDNEEEEEDGWKGKENSKMPRGGTLVVCPASLLQQWAGEVAKHCAAHSLSVCVHHGAARAAHPPRLCAADLVVTTYNLLQRDAEKKGVLTRVRWRRAVLDEAHAVRNHKSATCGAVLALRARARWCLTGTPVQNKDLDVFALLKFLRCTPFDDLQMWKKWIDNKSQGGQQRMSMLMRCLLLRRTKQQLQAAGQLDCLPRRELHAVPVTLDKEEMRVYQQLLVLSKTLFAAFLHQRAEKQADLRGRGDAYDKMHRRMVQLHGAKPVKSHEILVLLLRLRQTCCHCALVGAMLPEDAEGAAEGRGGGGADVDLMEELRKLTLEEAGEERRASAGGALQGRSAEPEEPQETQSVSEALAAVVRRSDPVFSPARQSSKIRAVVECLNTNVLSKNGHKAVVVSQWTSVLRLVEAELRAAGVRCVTLSGSVPVPQRPPLIQLLNDPRSDVRVMLLSLCAGGVGLNLCGANHLLLLDPHWNPQLEEQAQDRIYRVGQERDVHIYRFMCVDTVEQSIRKLQAAKLAVADAVLTGARAAAASKLTIEDLKMLFNMPADQ